MTLSSDYQWLYQYRSASIAHLHSVGPINKNTMFSRTRPGQPKSEAQRESRRERLIAPVQQFFRRSSPRPSSSSQLSRPPSPSSVHTDGPTEAQCKSGGPQGTIDLWSKAFNQLPEELKKDLDSLDKLNILQKLIAIAKQAEEQNAGKQFKLKCGEKEIDVREKAEGFVGCLNKFKEIGDIMVQYNPVHAALPWAGVRFILMVCDPRSAPPCN